MSAERDDSSVPDGNDEGVQQLNSGTVFISYKHSEDEGTARALSSILKKSIDADVEIFVAGDGSIGHSSDGFRKNIWRGLGRSSSVIALITPAVLKENRDWIIYESGAAWGRDVAYSPVVIGVPKNDTPEVLQMYHIVDGRSESEMEHLIEGVAKRLGAKTKKAFSNRFKQYLGTISSDPEEKAAYPPRLQAFFARLDGNFQAAQEICAKALDRF
jgi:hypothetical protein